MKQLYLDDNSKDDEIDYELIKEDLKDNIKDEETEIQLNKKKPAVSMKPDYNSKGEKIVVFSINIPLKHNDDSFTIDILINSEMYKNIGKHFKY